MKTVFVGLSGGVDSAVSAYLLKKEGYNVVGAFIKGWEPEFLPCTGKEDRLSAMRVAAHLQIPFVTYDLEEEYKREVVDYFIAEYKAGRTPNPDVVCNREIKFGAFWKKVKEAGADYIATGHYAQIVAPSGARAGLVSAGAMFSVSENREAGSRANVNVGERSTRDQYAQISTEEEGKYEMRTSKDKEKDQTYFLWTLNQDDLSHSLFPVGKFEKDEVRDIALNAKLPNAARRDSQGLCFLGHVDMHAFLKRYIPLKTGPVLDETGKKVGEHDGVWFYTLGQRHGLSLEEREEKQKSYIVAKDPDTNTLIVSSHPLPEKEKNVYVLQNQNWIQETRPQGAVRARFRYRQPLLDAEVSEKGIAFSSPQLAAAGQSCVVYDSQGSVLGGGIVN